MSVDQEAKPAGGLSALHKRADYPASARRAGIEGRVYVQAVINADGSVREAKVVRGIGGGCDEEALQVVRNAKFEPAQVDGEAVASRRTVFIQFELAD
jgi:TonB family protein